jgi:ketosteroid isomerase-like protein
MSSADAGNKQRMTDFLNRWFTAWNGRDYQALQGMMDNQVLSPAFFGSEPVHPQAVTRCFAMIHTAAPDWFERLDRIISIDGEWVTVHATGRGTFTKEYRGRRPTGQQIASPLLHSFRVVNGKLKEYHGINPHDAPLDTPVSAPDDVKAVRAEQGGKIETGAQIRDRQRLLAAFSAGQVSQEELTAGLSAAAPQPRCEALTELDHRRCQKPAVSGIYCEIHSQGVDPVHTV